MKKPVTIKEIAEEAKVSAATVSMILNNKDTKIGEATRRRVREIARERNYIPNTMARSLVTRHTRIIGLVIPDIVNPFFPEIARGAEDKATQERYSLIFCNTDDNLFQEDKYVEILSEKMVDGIIFAHSADRQGGAKGLEHCRVPIILIDRDYNFPNVMGKVLVDNTKASYEGVSCLLDRGYRKIAYIAGSMNTQTARDRLEGYKKALQERQIPFDEKLVKIGEYKSQWGEEAAQLLLNEKQNFDAIFCGNDLIAIGAMKTLNSAGLKIPEDIGIMGFDDIYMSSLIQPALTTIKQPNYEMGYKAAELLIQAIENETKRSGAAGDNNIILNTELVIRKSIREGSAK